MNLAVSSIAWSPEEDEGVASLLNERGIKLVELAPTKIWDNPIAVSDIDAKKVTQWWADRDIKVDAFQSMLFSRPDLKIFESENNRNECLQYLKNFIALAGRMGAKRMVFGSPKNRQRGDISYETASEIATGFFSELAEVALVNDVVFCIEPNAPQYACDFVTTARQGADLVRAVNHPGFGLHLDTACMALAGDDIARSIHEFGDIIQHFHISSPMLDQVEQRDDVDHFAAIAALKNIGYASTISIEMRPGETGTNVERVKKSVDYVQELNQG